MIEKPPPHRLRGGDRAPAATAGARRPVRDEGGRGAEVRVAWVMSAVMSIPATSSSDPSGLPVPAPVDSDAFRRAVGHFATGVTVVTARVDGIDHAMTASAFTSVSLDPVLVLVCVDKEARFRDAVLESGQWGVSVLSVAGRQAADWFATKGRPLIG